MAVGFVIYRSASWGTDIVSWLVFHVTRSTYVVILLCSLGRFECIGVLEVKVVNLVPRASTSPFFSAAAVESQCIAYCKGFGYWWETNPAGQCTTSLGTAYHLSSSNMSTLGCMDAHGSIGLREVPSNSFGPRAMRKLKANASREGAHNPPYWNIVPNHKTQSGACDAGAIEQLRKVKYTPTSWCQAQIARNRSSTGTKYPRDGHTMSQTTIDDSSSSFPWTYLVNNRG